MTLRFRTERRDSAPMRAIFIALLHFMLTFFRSRRAAGLEIGALRHQLAVLRRQTKRPRLTSSDRLLHHAHVIKFGPRSWRTKGKSRLSTTTKAR
ncbi:MAG: hypothetical protein DRI90_24035 [Deltaproteobacteria bacterium]|nr:MAG: hypothetical protein DRI90_24035 [Deltaproteobacteria bacterium]